MTSSDFTLQNKAILSTSLASIDLSHLHRRIFGCIPISLNSLTECCVGFVFCSLDVDIYGTKVK